MSERKLQNEVLLAAGALGFTLFRNNVGTGWAGKAQTIRHAQTLHLEPGDVVVRNARPLHAGLCKGSSDLVGLRKTIITEADVGRELALFAAVEVKTPSGRLSDAQRHFLEFVRAAGGVAGVARSPEDLASVAPGGQS